MRTLPLLLALAAVLLSCQGIPRAPAFPLAIRGRDLVTSGPEQTVILRGVSWEAGGPAAEVRYPVRLVVAGEGGPGAIGIVENRRTAVVAVRVGPGSVLEYATALEVPPGASVEMAPAGTALLMISEEDRYLPAASGYRLNRGLLHVALGELAWHGSIEAALERGRRDDRWYSRPGERYVPEGPIRVTILGWRGERCRVRVLPSGEPARILTFP